MNVVIFGASGMVGQGVLQECLQDPGVDSVLSIARSPSGLTHPKVREIVHRDFLDFSPLEGELGGLDACFWALGVTSAGLSEAEYRRVTHDFTLAAARTLVKANPDLRFVFISGAGADSSGTSRAMWARVKGATENDLLALPFKSVTVFRPAFIQPVHGIRSRTRAYRFFYALLKPLMPLLLRLFPDLTTTTERLGRAMLRAGREGAPKAVLEAADINRL
jgi:uncharacterized protein YbjT (DUF2867 family)